MYRILILLSSLLAATTLLAQPGELTPTATSDNVLQQLEGHYLFHGTSPYCEAPELTPNFYYDCDIMNVDGELRLTGFVGNVANATAPYYTGTYNAEDGTVRFRCGEDLEGESVYDNDGYRYFIYDFTLSVGTDTEGRTTLSRTGPFYFYAYKNHKWPRAAYASLSFTKGATLPMWNGNINHLVSPTTIDDLLCYTLEFENAHRIAASGYDITGLIYDPEGQLYAIAIVNGIIDVFGSITLRESHATINFLRIADLAPDMQSSAAAHSAHRPATPGRATVVFKNKSFLVDGNLLKEDIIQTFEVR